ncbi:hypothetical protein MTO96_021580 [Rhipicephalus appendiculatus]
MATKRPSPSTAGTSRRVLTPSPELKRESHSLPNFQLPCLPPPKPNKAASGPVRSPVPTTASVSRASLERYEATEIRALSAGGVRAVPGQSRAMPAEESRASRPASKSWWKKSWRRTAPSPYARNLATVLSKASGRRPAPPHSSAAFAATDRPPEAMRRTLAPAPFHSRGAMNHGDLEQRPEEAHPAGPTARFRADSQSMLAPTPPFWDTLFRRVLRSTRQAFRHRRSSSTSLPTSQQRDTETASSSSYLVASSDNSSRDNSSTGHKSDTRMMKAIFLSLFMFGASVLCSTAFFRLSDRVAREPRARHGDAALGVTTSLATVPPQDDLAQRGALPAAIPELKLRPEADGPPPVVLDNALVTATLEPDIEVTATAEEEHSSSAAVSVVSEAAKEK